MVTGPVESQSDVSSSARFFDANNQDRGWAKKVTRRPKAVGKLTFLDVETSDEPLAHFLTSLDRSPLVVQCTDLSGGSYTFSWASGYENGSTIRIQGQLVAP
jgi:hypothetical protein